MKPIKIYMGRNDSEVQHLFEQRGKGLFVFTNNHKEADWAIFVGGADISPALYGEQKLPMTYVSPIADEIDLTTWELFRDKPKIGICRGGQFLNVKSGGAMWQHVSNHGRYHDAIDLINKEVIRVTSTHHQMMIAGSDGEVLMIAHEADDFRSATQRSRPEFDTEVVWYETTKSLCYQPHPELDDADPKCVDHFFDLIDTFIVQ